MLTYILVKNNNIIIFFRLNIEHGVVIPKEDFPHYLFFNQ